MTYPYIITIEGLDGSGKETTSKSLEQYLNNRGYKVNRVSFPIYNKWHSIFVRWYLTGKFGKNPTKVHPIVASIFYAFDRFIYWHFSLKRQSKDSDFIIFDRFTESNMIYQAAKTNTHKKAIKTASFIKFLETKILRLPASDVVVALNTTTSTSIDAMKNRNKLDIHETNISYLKNVETVFYILISIFKWTLFNVYKTDPKTNVSMSERYTPEEIAHIIYTSIKLGS